MRLLIALIGCLAITACTSFVGGIRLESNVDTSPDTIDGLLDGSAPTLNVFLVHGMGDTPECYFALVTIKRGDTKRNSNARHNTSNSASWNPSFSSPFSVAKSDC